MSQEKVSSIQYSVISRASNCLLFTVYCLLATVLAACAEQLPNNTPSLPLQVELTADNNTQTLTTEATNVRELLQEVDIQLNDLDEVTPPLFTLLQDGMQVQVVRVSESLEVIPQSIPFEREVVRSETMEADDPPVILQGGKAGLQEVTVRIVYRDGLEAERWPTQTVVVEPAQNEIVMVGIGAGAGNVTFAGVLAYISGGTAVLLRGQTAFPQQIETGGVLDGRVFSLSPAGDYLLYTQTTTNTAQFNNSLWVVGTARDAIPRPLNIENVLWGGWNPAAVDVLQIAYTTATPTNSPPGWEANNDVWLLEIPADSETELEPQQLVEAYPATYGWWGGNYAWSPNGRFLAYSFADEVGLLDINAKEAEDRRRILQTFTEYDTLSSWVWVPTLSWSPNGRFLAFTNHNAPDTQALRFDIWVADATNGILGRFVEQAGMWGHVHWGPGANQIAFLRSTNPLDSQRSSYTLWFMDSDGSNARQIYPPIGENSYFAIEQQFMVWGPTGEDMAFIFNNALYFFNLTTGEARRATEDDAIASRPTWAPYGAAETADLPATQIETIPTPPPGNNNELLPEERP